MQGAGFRRRFPWNTALLVCSVPILILVIFVAWFRWELPPLRAYYLSAYWQCSTGAQSTGMTTSIQWLYKAAPGRKSVPLIDPDVDSSGFGLLPIGLSTSARQNGWTEVVRIPPQTWNSSELEAFLQRDFYGNQTFWQIVSQALPLSCIVPFITLFGVVWLRKDIVDEWRQLYRGPFGDDLLFDVPAVRRSFMALCVRTKERLMAYTKTGLSRPEPSTEASLFTSSNHAASSVSFAEPKHHSIFPGKRALRDGDKPPEPWDESQWID
jgi:hypothetical protein